MQDDLTHEFYWAAGFMEGEGSFMVSKHGRLSISCVQKEREPLERLQAVIGGKIYSFAQKGRTYNRLMIYGWRQCEPLMRKFRPLMSTRRQGQIDNALEKMVLTSPANRGAVNREKTACPRGHVYDTVTIEKAGPHRRCSVCIAESDERRRLTRNARQKAKYQNDSAYREEIKAKARAYRARKRVEA